MPTVGAPGRVIDLDHAIEIAPRVWWVGTVLPGDEFQAHVYLVEAGDQSALIDPGSVLTIDETLRKVAEVVPLDHVRWIVAHHADPDVCGSLPMLRERLGHPDLTIASEWRTFALLDHYGAGLPSYRVEDHDWALPLDYGRELRFQLTPYLHFPGAMVSYEAGTRVLFSADIFGGFVPDPTRLFVDDIDVAFEAVRPFHEHYMPSRDLLAAGLRRIRQRFPDIAMVAPQHGHILTGNLIPEMFERLSQLECGVLRFAEEDLDLARLVTAAEARRQLTGLLTTTEPTPEMFAMIRLLMAPMAAVRRVGVSIEFSDEGWRWFDSGGDGAGVAIDTPPRSIGRTITFELPGEPAAAATVVLESADDADDTLRSLLDDIAAPLRVATERLIRDQEETRERARLEEQARVDPLTGLLNRRGLTEALSEGPAAVALIDLDHFKAVNDTFGHDAGDEVLRATAAAIRGSVRGQDVVARIGGEEIVVVAPGADVDTGLMAAERIRRAVGALDLSGLTPSGRITVSIGVAAVDDVGDPEVMTAALTAADRALYAAKDAGRDRVERAA